MKQDSHRMEMSRMREAVAEATGERFCAYCNRYKQSQGGKFKKIGAQRRWQCKACTDLRRR